MPDPTRTQQRRLLVVVDDVFTDGLTLNEVARALRVDGGAETVSGLNAYRKNRSRI